MSGFEFEGQVYADQMDFVRRGRRCATLEPSGSDIERVDRHLVRFRAANPASPQNPAELVIPVRFVHLHDGDCGRVDEEARLHQIDVLNRSFEPHRIRFDYEPHSAKSADVEAWFRMSPKSAAERAAKRTLSVDPEEYLNFYTAEPAGGVIGWATFPVDLAGDPERDAIVVLHSTLPGAGAAPYDRGHVAVHQVAHWLGLYHTFQGGCSGFGDHQGDTPPHAGPNIGKPTLGGAHNACRSGTEAPIHNFMNYVDDEWMSHFSLLQGERMREHACLYRSGLVTASADEFDTRLAPVPTD